MTFQNSCRLPARKGKQLFLVTFLLSILMIIPVSVLSAATAVQPAPSSAKKQAKDKGPNAIEIETGYALSTGPF